MHRSEDFVCPSNFCFASEANRKCEYKGSNSLNKYDKNWTLMSTFFIRVLKMCTGLLWLACFCNMLDLKKNVTRNGVSQIISFN